MPRLKLEPLNKYAFAADITVRTTDLNYGGHLGNDKLISLVHEARVAFLAHHGFTEKDFGGAALIMGDIAVIYQGEA
ncbi:MAG: thioesterase family protein, partial [Acidobacteria bacterium]|nr:thioesterase family protein [Acidobacteriota bacterium]